MALFSFLSSSKKETEEISVLFRIGSSSVSGAIVEFRKGFKPLVLFSARESFISDKKPDSGKLVSLSSKALENVSAKISKDGLAYLAGSSRRKISISKVYCILSSPWHISGVKVFSVKNSKPFSISEKGLAAMASLRADDFKNGLVSELGAKYRDLVSLENAVMQVKLDGKEIHNPFGTKTKDAQISVFLSFSHKSVLDLISKIIGKHFHHTKIEFHTFTSVIYSAFKDIVTPGKDFISVDIGGEITDVSLIKDGVIFGTASFPSGKNELVREISSGMKIIPAMAASAARIYSDGKIGKREERIVGNIVDSYGRFWMKKLDGAVAEICGQSNVDAHKNIILASGKDVSKIFLNFLKSEKYIQPQAGANRDKKENSSMLILNEKTLAPFCEFGPMAVRETFLTAESVYINKIRTLAR